MRATNEEELTKLDGELRELTGCDIPVLRGDWFVATATRPPLYHALLQLPENAKTLEHDLGVDIAEAFLRPANQNIARAGFPKSGVSGQNRMVERSETKFRDVVYWKSYDFKPTNGRANLTRFPLGPLNLFQGQKHPFAAQAFAHDGGEIIFSLQNGLHAYLLVNGKDVRIDAGPIDVVNDPLKTSGTPEIVTGVSCMTCHKHGMIGLEDAIRENNTVVLEPKRQVERLYSAKEEMDGLLERDSKVFLDALEKAIGPFLRVGADKAKPIQEFPEPVGPLARAYRLGYLDLAAAVRELDVDDSATIEKQVGRATLKRLGLAGLLDGGVVSRLEWESRLEGVSIRLNGLSLMQQLCARARTARRSSPNNPCVNQRNKFKRGKTMRRFRLARVLSVFLTLFAFALASLAAPCACRDGRVRKLAGDRRRRREEADRDGGRFQDLGGRLWLRGQAKHQRRPADRGIPPALAQCAQARRCHPRGRPV